MTIDMDASRFADWLAQQDPERLWTVDGEYHLMGMRSLPCSGQELAALLRQRGGRLRIFAPTVVKAPLALEDMRQLAEVEEGGGPVFELAWVSDNTEGERWLIVEDTLAEELMREAANPT